jgi:hypothetical protein
MHINEEETLPESLPIFCPLSEKTISLLEHQGTRNFQDSINFLSLLETSISKRVFKKGKQIQ